MKWISIKDKLPDYGKWTLMTNGKSISFGYYDTTKNCWEVYANTGTPSYKEITHWLSLPELPKDNMEWINILDDRKPKCGDTLKIKYIDLIDQELKEEIVDYCCCDSYGFHVKGFDEFLDENKLGVDDYFFAENWDIGRKILHPYFIVAWTSLPELPKD